MLSKFELQRVMNHIKYAAIIGAALIAASVTADAADRLKVSRLDISRHADKLRIEMLIKAAGIQPGRDREVVFTPVIRSQTSADSLELPVVTICGRNRYYSHLRNHDLDPDETIYEAGSNTTVDYHIDVPFESWMERSRIDMREDVANCCDPAIPDGETPVALLDFVPEPYVPAYRFVALTGDSVIERTAEGKAYVDFIVNRTEIRPNYRRNKVEIAKIIASIDKVKNDPDATITRITIKGFASPEGSYSNNVRLAMGRTASLKEYVREHYNFDPEIMMTDYEPEDWEGLYAFLDTCTLPHRRELLEIARSPMEPDPRDHEMRRRYPEEYKLILDSIYPGLRHSDYTVKYNIRTFVDINELKRVYADDPSKLRPVDFQRIAATYPEGSKEYCDVYLTAVKLYPYDAQANVNAANIMMSRGDYTAAARYLHHAGDTPEAIYSRGLLAALNGDLQRAAVLFTQARDMGLDIASEGLAQTEAIRNRPTVTYLITPKP